MTRDFCYSGPVFNSATNYSNKTGNNIFSATNAVKPFHGNYLWTHRMLAAVFLPYHKYLIYQDDILDQFRLSKVDKTSIENISITSVHQALSLQPRTEGNKSKIKIEIIFINENDKS